MSGSKARPNTVLTWSIHGPDMVLMSIHSIDIGLRPCLLSLENVSALAVLKVKGRPNMVPKWFRHSPDMVLKSRHSVDICL